MQRPSRFPILFMPEELDYGPDSVNEGLVGGGEVGQDGVHRVFLQDEIFFSLGLLVILGLLVPVSREVLNLSLLFIKGRRGRLLLVENVHNCQVDPMS
jgi:hypothetical protein